MGGMMPGTWRRKCSINTSYENIPQCYFRDGWELLQLHAEWFMFLRTFYLGGMEIPVAKIWINREVSPIMAEQCRLFVYLPVIVSILAGQRYQPIKPKCGKIVTWCPVSQNQNWEGQPNLSFSRIWPDESVGITWPIRGSSIDGWVDETEIGTPSTKWIVAFQEHHQIGIHTCYNMYQTLVR